MKNKKISQGNCFVLLFFAVLFAIFYSRASQMGNREKMDKRHLYDQRHLKASQALKYGSKAVAESNYDHPDYPNDSLAIKKRPLVDNNFNVIPPSVTTYKTKSKRRRLALQLVKSVLRNRIRTLMRTIGRRFSKRWKWYSVNVYAKKVFFNSKTHSKTEIFFKRLDKRIYSNMVRVYVGKKGNHKGLLRVMRLRKLETVKWMMLTIRRYGRRSYGKKI